MNNPITTVLLFFGAIIIGSGVGLLFGTLQNAALKKHERLRESGKLKSGFVIMPGSFSRVAVLLVVLVIIQIAIPPLFQGNTQWIVSAGIILGYGWTLLKQLRNRSIHRA